MDSTLNENSPPKFRQSYCQQVKGRNNTVKMPFGANLSLPANQVEAVVPPSEAAKMEGQQQSQTYGQTGEISLPHVARGKKSSASAKQKYVEIKKA